MGSRDFLCGLGVVMALAVSPAWSTAQDAPGTGSSAGEGVSRGDTAPERAQAPMRPRSPQPTVPAPPALREAPRPVPLAPPTGAPGPPVPPRTAPALSAPPITPRAVTPAPPAPVTPGAGTLAEMGGAPYAAAPYPALPAEMFGPSAPSLTELSGFARGGIPQMIGDLGPGLSIPQPYPPTPPPPPPSPRRASALVPSVRGLKIAENQSPRPQDRVFFTFDYFSNVNGALNLKLGAPVSDILVYRYIFGFEKTFDNGNASIGARLPLDQLTANTRVPARFKQIGGTSTALDDMNIFGKFILRQNEQTGSLISVGLSITPTTGGGNFAGAKYIEYINTTEIQPFVAYIWNRGNFYIQGFSAFEFPVNQIQVTEMYNDIGMGYFVYRANDPHQLITAVVPTFEVHVNSPLNHRGFDIPNELAGTPDVVNLTYGLNVEFDRNSLLTFGFVTPVTGPRPFDYEAVLLFNFRFGRSAVRATPPIISG